MTEDEWVRATDAELRAVMWNLDQRRQRLLATAVCSALGVWVDYPEVDDVLRAVETYADTGKTKAALRRARQSVRALSNELSQHQPRESWSALALFTIQVAASENAVFATIEDARQSLQHAEGITEAEAGHRLFGPYRDIVSYLVRPAAFSPSWRTSTAIALARTMYDAREFSAMPILADALQDAGCDSDDILNHCRDTAQVHVRGCWVIDLVLGKA